MGDIYLVRHAKAGERREWKHHDIERPLSKKGRRQSQKLAERLAKKKPTELLSSEYVRCVETLEPLAESLDVEITVADELTEHRPYEPALKLIQTVPDGSVLCSHGDIIPAIIAAVKKTGVKVPKDPDFRKATVWVLSRNKRGDIVKAKVIPPPVH